MNIQEILNDKLRKPKEKTEVLSQLISEKQLTIDKLIDFAKNAKDADKATCIEALEFTTQSKPELVDPIAFDFITKCLNEKAPRVKWESAKVIGNTAHLNKNKLNDVIINLLKNSEHQGTVVRWSAAYALGQIIKLQTGINKSLVPAIEAIVEREEKNSIKKIYLTALKKISKK
ncbi:MAG: HEAT repeat domain-containing protein [Bacteroidota bacterium]